MKKLVLRGLAGYLALLSFPIIGSENSLDGSSYMEPSGAVIPSASYMVYEGAAETGGIAYTSKYVTFYTYDGQALATIEHGLFFPVMERKLDKNAPKPRPTKYKIIYNKGIRYKVAPGYWIIFYDKNNKRIDSWRFEDKDKSVKVLAKEDGRILEKNGTIVWLKYDFSDPNNLKNLTDFPLDLSIITEEK